MLGQCPRGSPSPLFYGVICYNRTTRGRAGTKVQKRWFSRPRFVRSRSAGSPLTVMYKWCQPSRLQYGSRAPDLEGTGRVRELFFQFGIFARETVLSSNTFHVLFECLCVHTFSGWYILVCNHIACVRTYSVCAVHTLRAS